MVRTTAAAARTRRASPKTQALSLWLTALRFAIVQPGSSMRRIKKSTEKFVAHIQKRGTSATQSAVVSSACVLPTANRQQPA